MHTAVTIARIEDSTEGRQVIIRDREPVSTARSPRGPRLKPNIDEVRVNLEDARFERWLSRGMPHVLTHCPRCNRDYELDVVWLRDQMSKPAGTVVSVVLGSST